MALIAEARDENIAQQRFASLGRLALLPVGEHPAVFEQVHRGLREVLGELDGGSGGSAGSAGRPGR